MTIKTLILSYTLHMVKVKSEISLKNEKNSIAQVLHNYKERIHIFSNKLFKPIKIYSISFNT